MRHILVESTGIRVPYASCFFMKVRILLSNSSIFLSRLTIRLRSSSLFLVDTSRCIKIFLLPSSSLFILWSMLSCCFEVLFCRLYIHQLIIPPTNAPAIIPKYVPGGVCHVDTLVTEFRNASPYTKNLSPHDTMIFSTNYNIFFPFD